jgi:predicted nucleotidyltransferase component of viral defense system
VNSDALKERLKVIAKEKTITFNEVWKQLLLERFLARLSNSSHHEKFIFKGGLLLAQYVTIGRETTDADFLMTKIKSEAPAIETAVKEISSIKLEDGFTFEWSKIEELNQPHMDYPGFRITLNSSFEKMKDKIQLDVGVGDLVTPVKENFEPFAYKGKPMFAGEISLMVYPVETIFAEKLETIISKGAANSRMKDYHDAILMIRENGLLDPKKATAAISSTFGHRGTKYLVPIEFDASGMATLQGLWGRHLTGLGAFREKLKLPDKMGDALAELNRWLTSIA